MYVIRLGNKGGVGIRITIAGSRILFVNAHLAAHQNAVKERNAQFRRIEVELSEMLRQQDSNQSSKITSQTDNLSASRGNRSELFFRVVSDRIFFMGDLNYRLRGTRWESFI